MKENVNKCQALVNAGRMTEGSKAEYWRWKSYKQIIAMKSV